MTYSISRRGGFTIIELLIVIVIIAVLASITIVAYNGIQGRSRDARRMQDLSLIMQGLEIYKTNNGSYPVATFITGAAGWEVSTDGTNATDFLAALKTGAGGMSRVPVDPVNVNRGTAGSLDPAASKDLYEYFYYRYGAGEYGCDSARGEYYVLGVTRLDGVASGANSPQSPGWSCTGRSWSYEGAWVTGRFTR